MTTWVRVPFRGDGAGEGALAWGQVQCWRAMVAARSSMPMGAVVPVGDGRTATDFAAELGFWTSRYASLRTRVRVDGDEVVQVVAGDGETAVRVVEDAEPEAAANALLREWLAEPFDYEHEWPVRLAVVTHGGAVTHTVVVICHLAADAAAVEVMNRELVAWYAGDIADYTAPQPLELAAQQRTRQRATAVSLRHWEAHLRAVPARRFPPARKGDGFRRIVWDSPALHLGARRLAARVGVDTAPVLLAAFAIGLGQVSGSHPLVTQVIVGNRFRPGLGDVVSSITQNGLCVLDVAGVPVEEAVGRAVRASLSANKNAYYDPDDWLGLLERVRADRGERVDLGVFYNDRRMSGPDTSILPSEADVLAARSRTRVLAEVPMALFTEQLMVNIDDVPGTVRVTAEVDTDHLSVPDLAAVLAAMEAAVVEPAAGPS